MSDLYWAAYLALSRAALTVSTRAVLKERHCVANWVGQLACPRADSKAAYWVASSVVLRVAMTADSLEIRSAACSDVYWADKTAALTETPRVEMTAADWENRLVDLMAVQWAACWADSRVAMLAAKRAVETASQMVVLKVWPWAARRAAWTDPHSVVMWVDVMAVLMAVLRVEL